VALKKGFIGQIKFVEEIKFHAIRRGEEKATGNCIGALGCGCGGGTQALASGGRKQSSAEAGKTSSCVGDWEGGEVPRHTA